MKTLKWTHKQRCRALRLIQGVQYFLSEVSNIINIILETARDFKKCNTASNKVYLVIHSSYLFECKNYVTAIYPNLI